MRLYGRRAAHPLPISRSPGVGTTTSKYTFTSRQGGRGRPSSLRARPREWSTPGRAAQRGAALEARSIAVDARHDAGHGRHADERADALDERAERRGRLLRRSAIQCTGLLAVELRAVPSK